MLGKTIAEMRIAMGWSQVELGKRLGVSKQTISNWENENIMPSIDTLVRLARLLNVSTDYLLGLDQQLRLDVQGLPVEVIAHLTLLIDDYRALQKQI